MQPEGRRDPPVAHNDDPMDVGAVQFSGKGNVKGKTKLKGIKGRGKSKGKESDSRQGGGKGPQQARPEPFQGECGYCGIWGHKRGDCRTRQAAERSGGRKLQRSRPPELRRAAQLQALWPASTSKKSTTSTRTCRVTSTKCRGS